MYVGCVVYVTIAGLTAVSGDVEKGQVDASTLIRTALAVLIAFQAFRSDPNQTKPQVTEMTITQDHGKAEATATVAHAEAKP